jgi:polyferredoxin
MTAIVYDVLFAATVVFGALVGLVLWGAMWGLLGVVMPNFFQGGSVLARYFLVIGSLFGSILCGGLAGIGVLKRIASRIGSSKNTVPKNLAADNRRATR